MRLLRIALPALLLLVLGSGLLLAAQRRRFGRQFNGGGFPRGFPQEDGSDILPTDSHQKDEWVFARYHYESGFGGFGGFRRWAADYPKSDRQLVMGVHRLTRIDTQPIEHVVNAGDKDIFDWPWIFVEDAGQWRVSDETAKLLREYLDRGGFLVLDDTHGDYEWEREMEGVRMIIPDAQVEELPNNDEIFHVLYDLDQRFQIPGTRYIWGQRSYRADESTPHWRAIRDKNGRIVIGIWHNSDVGDAWEWADSPNYPERATSLAYRLAINYIIYAMTH
jgi:Domain of unknown function (DUF4159)